MTTKPLFISGLPPSNRSRIALTAEVDVSIEMGYCIIVMSVIYR